MMEERVFKRCSTCKKPIEFEQSYYSCSVSTCNRKRTALYFCSVGCFESHVPEMRHRDAWAEQNVAPTLEEWLREQAAEQAEAEAATASENEAAVAEAPRRRVVGSSEPAAAPMEPLVVVSKLKAYIRARSGMNTSDGVVGPLSDHVRRLCDQAISNAASDGRKTVMDRDFRFSSFKD